MFNIEQSSVLSFCNEDQMQHLKLAIGPFNILKIILDKNSPQITYSAVSAKIFIFNPVKPDT